jgi:hypothetical protein
MFFYSLTFKFIDSFFNKLMMEAQANPCRLRCCPDQEGRILTTLKY